MRILLHAHNKIYNLFLKIPFEYTHTVLKILFKFTMHRMSLYTYIAYVNLRCIFEYTCLF